MSEMIFISTIIFIIMIIVMMKLRNEKRQAFDEAELIAVLAAAASEILDQPVKIKKIQFLRDQQSNAWGVTGRLNIMASHLIVRRKQ